MRKNQIDIVRKYASLEAEMHKVEMEKVKVEMEKVKGEMEKVRVVSLRRS
jgi:septum formation topological specificity factor MinE